MVSPADYRMPQSGVDKLDAYAAGIIRNPGQMIDPRVFEQIEEQIDLARLVPGLADTIPYEDFVNALRLALLTESATDTYSVQFQEVAKIHGAGWLAAFNERVWDPDEQTHRTPYFRTLVGMGCDGAELQREMRQAQEREFDRKGASDPASITMFGTNQELITDAYHGSVAFTIKPYAPLAAHGIFLVKKREKLHTEWYRKMTAIQIEHNSELLANAAYITAHFEMPEVQVAPQYAPMGGDYAQMMGMDRAQVMKDLVRIFHQLTNDVHKTGRFLLDVGAERGVQVRGISVGFLRALLTQLHLTGFIGEVVLQSMGLTYLFQKEEERTLKGRVRALLRNVVVERVGLKSAVV
ncbi:MAG TPA: acyl-ACP desaturase [Dehalococcoidia bacterium]|nr:acyl-ACP desaturase [Dehalococcoidia bacterium]